MRAPLTLIMFRNKVPTRIRGVSKSDVDALTRQLGRAPRGVMAVILRCACHAPAVIKTAPRLPDGQPFPTLYYLTLPRAVAVFSQLESEGFMRTMNDELDNNTSLRKQYMEAHLSYISLRNDVRIVPEIANVSVGGMPYRVKCLHALVAHALVTGANPVGNMALSAVNWSLRYCDC